MQAQLGVVAPAAPAPQPEAEEVMCVVCMDAPKQYTIMPCGHVCACAACAQRLLDEGTPCCPVCRGPIQDTMRVFF